MSIIKNETVIKNIIKINASSKTIFSALTDEKETTCWFPEQILMEPKLGGRVKFELQSYSGISVGTFFVEGKITEFIPNKKLSYLCNQIDDIDFPRTLVTIDLEEIDVNRTKMIYKQTILKTKRHIRLNNWRSLLQEPLSEKHEDLSDNWNTCAIGEIIQSSRQNLKNIQDLNPESMLLGYDFFMAIKNKRKDIALDILQKLENVQTIWK